MSEDPEPIDTLLSRLETLVGRLADPGSPLERLVADHEEAQRLLREARQRLEEAERRLAPRRPG